MNCAALNLPCQAVGYARSLKNPSYQASGFMLVAEPQSVGPTSILWGTTNSCGRGLGVMTVVAPIEVRVHAAVASFRSEQHRPTPEAFLPTVFGKSLIYLLSPLLACD